MYGFGETKERKRGINGKYEFLLGKNKKYADIHTHVVAFIFAAVPPSAVPPQGQEREPAAPAAQARARGRAPQRSAGRRGCSSGRPARPGGGEPRRGPSVPPAWGKGSGRSRGSLQFNSPARSRCPCGGAAATVGWSLATADCQEEMKYTRTGQQNHLNSHVQTAVENFILGMMWAVERWKRRLQLSAAVVED